jgi:hypothetical protein
VSTLADYAGRTYDVSAFAGQAPAGDVLLEQTLIRDGGTVCTGVQKAAQKAVIELLREKGSMPYRAGRGTDLMTRFRRGDLRQESDVAAAFALAAADVVDNLAALEPAAAPADERVTALSLAGIETHPGYCKLVVDVVTAAGASRREILPIATTP